MITMRIFNRCDGEDVRLMLWDTAGQEEFDAITKAYYRGAQACVLAFSSTDRSSFEAIRSWKMKVKIDDRISGYIVQYIFELTSVYLSGGERMR